jgi:hypothetical protein
MLILNAQCRCTGPPSRGIAHSTFNIFPVLSAPALKDYLHLHFIVLIWGFTAILGLLISYRPWNWCFTARCWPACCWRWS